MIGAPEVAAQVTAAIAEVEPSKPTISGAAPSVDVVGTGSNGLRAWASIDVPFLALT
jgi:hypothetical protein